MKQLKKFQKQLRTSQTEVENILWYYLRNRRLQGYKFRRQHSMQGYIVDFVCLEHRLVVELDGEQHAKQRFYDMTRTKKFEEEGFLVLRFWNNEVLENRAGVLEAILAALMKLNPSPARANSALATSPTRGEVSTSNF